MAKDKVDYTGASAEEYVERYTNRPEDAGNAKDLWGSLGGPIHAGLGLIGMTPGVGNVADLIDAGIYTAEGDKLGAGLSLASAVPGLGLVAGGTKLLKGAKGVKAAKSTKGIKAVRNPDGTYKTVHKKGINMLLFPDEKSIKAGLPGKYGLKEVDSKVVNEAREKLQKELLSEESYGKWVDMMKQGRLNRIASLESIKAPESIIAPLRKLTNKGLSKEGYNQTILDQLKTRVYAVPKGLERQLFGKEIYGGAYSDKFRAIFIPEYTLKGGMFESDKLHSTVLHELKHAAQAPYFKTMENVYGDMFKGFNRSWRRKQTEAASGIMKDPRISYVPGVKFPLPAASDYTQYMRDPVEVSARLSEMRAGFPNVTAREDLVRHVVDPNKMDWLLKNVWGAAPVGAMLTGKQRWDKAFGEEKGE